MPKIPSTPISYADAWPILEHLGGPDTPREWQGSLPFTYHLGPGPVRVKLHLKQDYQYRTIWNVIGRIPGIQQPDQWVVAGNHRDAWVYGAVDPGSGTAAMLETVHGLGELLKSGWRPHRTIVFASWDAEEFGLIGSTEWGEQHASDLAHAIAYFNMDVAVAGPKFGASAVPSLKQFVRDVAKTVPAPNGAKVFDDWKNANQPNSEPVNSQETATSMHRPPAVETHPDVPVGDLGSGSDYAVFLQHLGIPSVDIGSTGPYGVYHSVFDNFNWFTKFGDPDFVYEQEMARVFGLEALRLADVDIIPYDYQEYGKEIEAYIRSAKTKAEATWVTQGPDFSPAIDAAHRFQEAGTQALARQRTWHGDAGKLNQALIETERALLIPEGLPNRPWYRHAIYAPGEYTGYAAVVIPGVNEAIDKRDAERTRSQLNSLAAALRRASKVLEDSTREGE
jgi:N-acetylated-alpha-linked acidic dipeptidase